MYNLEHADGEAAGNLTVDLTKSLFPSTVLESHVHVSTLP